MMPLTIPEQNEPAGARKMTFGEALAWKEQVGRSSRELRRLLIEGYEREAWRALGYRDWTDCLERLADEYGVTARRMWQLHAANKIEAVLTEQSSAATIPESHLRPLAALEPEQQKEAYRRAVETAPGGRVTGAHVRQVVKELRPPERYLEIWELEQGVRSWLKLQDAASADEGKAYDKTYFLEEARKRGQAFDALLSHLDRFHRPRRKGDVLQALNNVLDQLRQEARRQEPEEEQPPPPDRLAVHYSSERSDWETPQWLYNILDEEFHFDVDVCATPENAKHVVFITPEQDGLAQEWAFLKKNEQVRPATCFCNPPYGKEISLWVRKAHREARLNGATVICLLPARTDTSWWWEYCIRGEIRFLRGRLRFGGSQSGAPFPSAVVIFGPGVEKKVVWWEEGSRNNALDGDIDG